MIQADNFDCSMWNKGEEFTGDDLRVVGMARVKRGSILGRRTISNPQTRSWGRVVKAKEKETPAKKVGQAKSAPAATNMYKKDEVMRIKKDNSEPRCTYCKTVFKKGCEVGYHVQFKCKELPPTPYLENVDNRYFAPRLFSSHEGKAVSLRAIKVFLHSLDVDKSTVIFDPEVVLFWLNDPDTPLRITAGRLMIEDCYYYGYIGHKSFAHNVTANILEKKVNRVIIPVTFFENENSKRYALNKTFWSNKEHIALVVLTRESPCSKFIAEYYDSYDETHIFSTLIQGSQLQKFLKRLTGGQSIVVPNPKLYSSLTNKGCGFILTLLKMGEITYPCHYLTTDGLKRRLIDSIRRGSDRK